MGFQVNVVYKYQQTGEGIYDNARMGGRVDEEDGMGSSSEGGGGGVQNWRREEGEGDKIVDLFSVITCK